MSKWLMKQQMREAEERAEMGEPNQEDYGEYLDQMDREATEARPELIYTVLAGETIWEIAKKTGIRAEELMEHNDIRPSDVVEGYQLHLPKPAVNDPANAIQYEVFPTPRLMHVSKEDGTKKFSFGNPKTWNHIKKSGPLYPENTNLVIVALAKVPIGDDTAAYYMDANSLGDYEATGRVNFTLGFNWNHLAEGFYEKPVEPEVVENIQTIEEKVADTIAEMEPTPIIHLNPNFYKSSYKEFSEPMTYIVNSNNEKPEIEVHELDGRRMPVVVKNGKGVVISGFFEKDGRMYGRPKDAVPNGYWFGIPIDNMTLEDEMYTVAMDLPAKVATHSRHLTSAERWEVAVARTLSRYTWLSNKINKTLKKSKE